MHLSLMPQVTRYGFLGHVNWAVVEACDVTAGGGIVLTSGVGTTPTFCNQADRILIELNRRNPPTLLGIHDIYEPADPPNRRQIPIYSPSDRIGSPIIAVPPSKIAGIVETKLQDEARAFSGGNAATRQIGMNVAEFLARHLSEGRLPAGFLPIQSGVGDIANSVLLALGGHPDIPAFQMYTEVIQDAVIELIERERITFASSCSLTVSNQVLQRVYDNLEWFRSRILLRPQEISNNPEVIRRLGLISINTAIEVDIFGNVNSTHVMGRKLMNGIGGSGDFTRNAYLSTFTCPSTAKGGRISTIVPLVSHVDHSEHSVQIIATEQGIADLRGKSPYQRALEIINNCAHPEFRDVLMSYLTIVEGGYTPHTLSAAFRMHERFQRTGDMRGVSWEDRGWWTPEDPVGAIRETS